jgi:hypothetical protein
MQSARESTLHISAICRKQIKWPTADLLGKCHWPSTVTLRGALSVIDLIVDMIGHFFVRIFWWELARLCSHGSFHSSRYELPGAPLD